MEHAFAAALGSVGILERCEETYAQCATGTPARHAFDELDLKLRRQSEAQSVSLVGSTTLPSLPSLPSLCVAAIPPRSTCSSSAPSSVAATTTSCCSARSLPHARPSIDISSVSCDVDASLARTVFYDFARQEPHPRIQAYPSALEWTSFYEIPGTNRGEVSAIYGYHAEDDRHDLDIHAHLEPLASISRVELDYDVQNKLFESSWELHVRKTVCRLETRQGGVRRAGLKTRHDGRYTRHGAISGSVSSVGYADDGTLKLELFKRKHANKEASGCVGLCPSAPTVRVVLVDKDKDKGERVKEVGIKQWLCNDRIDVHASMKRVSVGKKALTVGVGTHQVACQVRTGTSIDAVPSLSVKTKGSLTSEVQYAHGKNVKLTCAGPLWSVEQGTFRVSFKAVLPGTRASERGAKDNNNGMSLHAGIYCPL